MFSTSCNIILISLTISTLSNVADPVTSWTVGLSKLPFANRAMAIGYDTDTGIIHMLGGAYSPSCYVTYNTMTETMSSLQSIPNDIQMADQPYAQTYIQINRIIYIYNHQNRCIDTFNMEILTYNSCWSSVGSSIPSNTMKGCLAIDDTARYFFVLPETNIFFFYDNIEREWYFGPNTVQSAHLFSGCDVIDNKLFYWGGQQNWGQSGAGLMALEYLDISNMNALKLNPNSFSWNIQYNFLPIEHDFVRNVRLNDDVIYSFGGYRYYGDGQYIKVLNLDLTSNTVEIGTEIPTFGIGGSLVWDSCQHKFYYFGGFDGSSDLDTFYYSNTISNAKLPSKYNINCMVPGYMDSTTTSTTTTTPTTETTITSMITTTSSMTTTTTIPTQETATITSDKDIDPITTKDLGSSIITTTSSMTTTTIPTQKTATTTGDTDIDPITTKDLGSSIITTTTSTTTTNPLLTGKNDMMNTSETAVSHGLEQEIYLIIIGVLAIIICVVLVFCAFYFGKRFGKKNETDDGMKKSLSEIDGKEKYDDVVQVDIGFSLDQEIKPSAPPDENNGDSERDSIKEWIENVIKLPYLDNFIKNGYDSFDLIMEITDKNELSEIGIQLKGHQNKILKQILILKQSQQRTNHVEGANNDETIKNNDMYQTEGARSSI